MEWPCCLGRATCGRVFLFDCFEVLLSSGVGLDDMLLGRWWHCVCLGMVGGEIFFGECFIEVDFDAICSYLVGGEVYIVNCFAWWKVHLGLLSGVGGFDSLFWAAGWDF